MSSIEKSDLSGVDKGGETLRNSIRDLCTLTLGSSIGSVQDQKEGVARAILATIGPEYELPAVRGAPDVSPDAFSYRDAVTAEGVAAVQARAGELRPARGWRVVDDRSEAMRAALSTGRIPPMSEMIERADFAIEGEFDGLAATPVQSREVVEFILTGMAPGSERDSAIASFQRIASEPHEPTEDQFLRAAEGCRLKPAIVRIAYRAVAGEIFDDEEAARLSLSNQSGEG